MGTEYTAKPVSINGIYCDSEGNMATRDIIAIYKDDAFFKSVAVESGDVCDDVVIEAIGSHDFEWVD